MKYKFISADVPWWYETWRTPEGLPHRRRRGRGMATAVYKGGVMCMDDLLAMGPGVRAVSEKSASLLLWVTGPHLFDAEPIAKAWGFPHFSTIPFVWVKTNPNTPSGSLIDPGEDLWSGLGYWTGSNIELALLFLRGTKRPPRFSTGVKQVVIAPVGEHSRKPPEIHDRYEKLMGPGNYLDLFARSYRRGKLDGALWTCLGDELDEMDINDSLARLASLDLPYLPKGVREPLTPASEVQEWQEQLRPEPVEGHNLRMAI